MQWERTIRMKIKNLLVVSVLLLLGYSSVRAEIKRPKLVVGIVVDQMRWDYLNVFDHLFGEDGFRRLRREGFSYDNTMIDYLPTVTSCGHSCIYSGSVPAVTGIAGNDFYIGEKRTYCTDDSTVSSVGGTVNAGKMSPRNMRVTTICDALKMAQGYKSRTIGVSLKDRGAILPAGHTADAAYWFDKEAGKFITSSYYMKTLPEWVVAFNRANGVEPAHDVRYSPEGNELVMKMAIAALKNEHLGKGNTTDFLAISFSSTDYVGHKFGTTAPETEEVYHLLDQQIGQILSALDSEIGKGNYLLFLSADHGAAHNADEMKQHGIPAGRYETSKEKGRLNARLKNAFRTDRSLIKDIIENRIYIDHKAIEEISENAVTDTILNILRQDERIAYAVSFKGIGDAAMPAVIRERICRGYNPQRSGDIQIVLQPGYYCMEEDSYLKGTTHSAWYPYDSHIPLVFFGWNIPHGDSDEPVSITDIAATIASRLGVQMPDGCIGKPLKFK